MSEKKHSSDGHEEGFKPTEQADAAMKQLILDLSYPRSENFKRATDFVWRRLCGSDQLAYSFAGDYPNPPPLDPLTIESLAENITQALTRLVSDISAKSASLKTEMEALKPKDIKVPETVEEAISYLVGLIIMMCECSSNCSACQYVARKGLLELGFVFGERGHSPREQGKSESVPQGGSNDIVSST